MSHPERDAWPTKRIRFLTRRTLTPEQRYRLSAVSQVTFLPMEAVGLHGELDLSSIRPIDEVRSGYTLFFDGDIIVAKITPCFENGKGALVRSTLNGVGYGTTELHVLSPESELDGRFLYYVTTSQPFRRLGEAAMTGAAGQKRVPEEFIRDYSIAVPPLLLQRAIANYLDVETARLDSLIAAKEHLLTLLAEKRRALITHAVTRGLNPNAPLRDSGIPWLGEIPAHWRMERLKYHLNALEQGWSPQCDNTEATSYEWGVLKVGCVNGWEFAAEENKRLPEGTEPLVEYEIQPGDVLMSRANTTELLGSTALVRTVRPHLLLCDKLYRLQVDESRLSKEYLVMFLRSSPGRHTFERDATGASNSMQNIGQDSVRNAWIPIPPLLEQETIVAHIAAETAKLDALRASAERTIALLKERRAALIAAAVTGKLDLQAAVR